MRVISLGLATLAVILSFGCSDAMSVDDYAHAWRASIQQYKSIDKNPADAATGAQDAAQATADAASQISMQIRKIADSIKDLKAPPEFQALQEETYIFYRGQADDYSGYSEAIGSGQDDKIQTATDRLNDFAGMEQQKISKIIDGLGANSDRFRPSWIGVFK